MGTINKPNIVIPLAASYNTRGIDSYTNAISNNIDQRKINCVYDTVKNSITGSPSLYLTNRPGPGAYGTSLGSASQVSYLVTYSSNVQVGQNIPQPWLFGKTGDLIQVSDNANTSTIYSSSSVDVCIPCFIDHTLISNNDSTVLQLCSNANIGFLPHRVFYNSYSSYSLSGWTQIVDADFTALTHKGKMEHMDGYAFILESKSRIFNSDLNSLSSWTATNFITKQIQQDVPVGLAKFKNQILAFGNDSFEVFYNAGNATGSPLSPIKQLQKKIGLAGWATNFKPTNYYAVLGDRMYFIGNEGGTVITGGNSLGIFVYDGANVQKVSTSVIDRILFGDINFLNIGCIYPFVFHGKKAIAISLSGSSFTTGGSFRWLMYFPEWNEWFEWSSSVFGPVNTQGAFIGCRQSCQLYAFTTTNQWADDTSTGIAFSIQFMLPGNGHDLKRMPSFGITGDTARSTNNLLVEFSDDDYLSFKTAGTIDMTRANKMLYRGGTYRKRAIRLSSSNTVETRLQNFIANVK